MGGGKGDASELATSTSSARVWVCASRVRFSGPPAKLKEGEMEVVYLPDDFFDWIGERMSEDSLFGTPPSKWAPLRKIIWRDEITILPEREREW